MRSRGVIVIAVVLGAIATAGATAPCFHDCHLSQGQPLLVDGIIWVRPCTTVKGKETCVLQRLDAEGAVLSTLPASALDDTFEQKYLENRQVAGLYYTTPWENLRKPYTVSLETATMTLRLEKTTLTCERSSGIIKRPLGCTPSAVSVRVASITRDNKPEDPTGIAVMIATCGAGKNVRDVIAVCQARPPKP